MQDISRQKLKMQELPKIVRTNLTSPDAADKSVGFNSFTFTVVIH